MFTLVLVGFFFTLVVTDDAASVFTHTHGDEKQNGYRVVQTSQHPSTGPSDGFRIHVT